jgi:hypothetical protein
VNFETDIKPLFSQSDVDAMLNENLVGVGNTFDLSKYEDVKAHATGPDGILARVQLDESNPLHMPCGPKWTQDKIDTFQAWVDAGFPEFEPAPPQITVVNPGNLIDFNDVPEGETAMRAAVFDCVVSEETINFSVSAPGPTGPY